MLTPGQASDLDGFDGLAETIQADVVIADVVIADVVIADVIIADKDYDADKRVRAVLARSGKTAVIPPRRNRKNPATYDKELYKKRHHIENFFSRLKDFRAIATRYEKNACNFLAGVYLAAAIVWLN